MPTLTGLPGTNGKDREAVYFHKGHEIRKILKDNKAAITAGDNGAINIWRDDTYTIRCEVQRYCVRIEEQKFTLVNAAIEWANKWLPQIGEI